MVSYHHHQHGLYSAYKIQLQPKKNCTLLFIFCDFGNYTSCVAAAMLLLFHSSFNVKACYHCCGGQSRFQVPLPQNLIVEIRIQVLTHSYINYYNLSHEVYLKSANK